MAKENSFFKMEMLILLILKQGDCYGYELATKLKKQTDGVIDMKMGTLYPILYKLADAQYISSVDIREGRRIKVIYKIEPKGEELLNQLKEKYLSWVDAIEKVIENNNQD